MPESAGNDKVFTVSFPLLKDQLSGKFRSLLVSSGGRMEAAATGPGFLEQKVGGQLTKQEAASMKVYSTVPAVTTVITVTTQ